MIYRRDELRLIGLVGGALVATVIWGAGTMLIGGVVGLVTIEFLRQRRVIR